MADGYVSDKFYGGEFIARLYAIHRSTTTLRKRRIS